MQCRLATRVQDVGEWLAQSPDLEPWRLMCCVVPGCDPQSWGDVGAAVKKLTLVVHPDKTSDARLHRWVEPLRELQRLVRDLDRADAEACLRIGCCAHHEFWGATNWHRALATAVCARLEEYMCFDYRTSWLQRVCDESTFRDFALAVFVLKDVDPQPIAHADSNLERVRNAGSFVIRQFLRTTNFAVHKSKQQVNRLMSHNLAKMEFNFSKATPSDERSFMHEVANLIADIVDENPALLRQQLYEPENDFLHRYAVWKQTQRSAKRARSPAVQPTIDAFLAQE